MLSRALKWWYRMRKPWCRLNKSDYNYLIDAAIIFIFVFLGFSSWSFSLKYFSSCKIVFDAEIFVGKEGKCEKPGGSLYLSSVFSEFLSENCSFVSILRFFFVLIGFLNFFSSWFIFLLPMFLIYYFSGHFLPTWERVEYPHGWSQILCQWNSKVRSILPSIHLHIIS